MGKFFCPPSGTHSFLGSDPYTVTSHVTSSAYCFYPELHEDITLAKCAPEAPLVPTQALGKLCLSPAALRGSWPKARSLPAPDPLTALLPVRRQGRKGLLGLEPKVPLGRQLRNTPAPCAPW